MEYHYYSKKINSIFQIMIFVIIVGGIVLGFTYKVPIVDIENLVSRYDDEIAKKFNWMLMLSTWAGGAVFEILLYAVRGLLENQEDQIYYLKNIHNNTNIPQNNTKTSTHPTWVCSNCSTENDTANSRCKQCGRPNPEAIK